jgi:hypothetical protein
MKINDTDKNQIKLMDEQVLMLQEKNASDEAILDALADFIPDIVCLVQNLDKAQLLKYVSTFPGFAYFISIIHLVLNEDY